MTPAGPSVAAPPALDEALAAAAEACCGALPADGEWSGSIADGAAPAVPGAGAQAVAATLPGLGRLVLAVAAPMARGVQVGPPPAEDLLDGLKPAFTAAAAGFGVAAAALDDYTVVDIAALAPNAGEDAHGLLLLDGDTHKATLVFLAPAVAPAPPAALSEHEFAPLAAPGAPPAGGAGRLPVGGPIELLHEVEMGVTVELGRTRMLVREILDLSPGSVIELDRAAGAPIDVLVNGTLIARGEVVVIDEEFGIRITEVIGYEDSGASPASHKADGARPAR
jgi:flagellar motor switch protein FliN/FliY